jgi:hypothetical protein
MGSIGERARYCGLQMPGIDHRNGIDADRRAVPNTIQRSRSAPSKGE